MTCPIQLWSKKTPSKIAIKAKEFGITYSELDALIDRSAPVSSIVAKHNLDTIASIFTTYRKGGCLHLISPHGSNFSKKNDFPSFPPHHALFLFETSGSTGSSKGVLLSGENMHSSAEGVIDYFQLGQEHAWFLTVPLFHLSGVSILFRIFHAGGTLILNSEKSLTPALINTASPSHISLVPTQLYRLLQSGEPLNPHIRFLIGGAETPPALLDLANTKGHHLDLTYGMSETASAMTIGRDNLGKPLKHRTLYIDEQGEVFVGGKVLFVGYVINQEWTPPTLTEKGLLPTRDLGKWSEEGNLEILGRKDRVIIKGGENIYPEEIERILLSLPLVEEAKVVPLRDPEYGQLPVAFIRGSTRAAIETALREKLPRFKRPSNYYQMPHYEGFKPNLKELEKLASSEKGRATLLE